MSTGQSSLNVSLPISGAGGAEDITGGGETKVELIDGALRVTFSELQIDVSELLSRGTIDLLKKSPSPRSGKVGEVMKALTDLKSFITALQKLHLSLSSVRLLIRQIVQQV